jgi:hypothetical protein
MPTIVACASCHRPLRIPDDLGGQRVKCPTCGHIFDAAPVPAQTTPSQSLSPPAEPSLGVEAGSEPSASASAAGSSSNAGFGYVEVADQRNASGVEPTERRAPARRCPDCGGRIPRRESRCRHCGADLRGIDDARFQDSDGEFHQPRDCEPHRGPTVLLLGIGSLVMPFLCIAPAVIGLPLGIVAWVMGQRDLRRMNRGEVDDEGRGSTQGGMVCGIIGTILSGFVCLILAGMVSLFVVAAQARKPAPAPAPRAPVAPPPRPGQTGAVLHRAAAGSPYLA